ncbi:putative sensor-like histidine kinase [Paenibacillus konkukensis]|uniref:Sensor-like histidine kinase n=1 Tax=Paenibacillus konkukensis TaxID=2020716 RepID=A0ABY4RRK7_9BACL|nr:sensor histidine kinase [Paenibacillus konkukensis]UQZ85146.1 putative sensor-like histidine kinase [Paenibacillus konkukensis]
MKKTYHAFLAKNLATFLIPMLIPILVLGALSTFLIQQYIKKEINNNNMNLLKQTKQNIELIFNELDTLNLHIVASAIQFTNLQNMLKKPYPEPADYEQLASLKNFIDSPSIGKPYIDSIYIYIDNENNRFISSTSGGLIDLGDFYDQGWYERYIRHSPSELMWAENRSIVKPTTGRASAVTNVITMFRRITLSDNSSGVIVLNVKPDYIMQTLSRLDTLKGQTIFILDAQDEFIFRTHNDMLPESDLASIRQEAREFFPIRSNGEDLIVNKLPSGRFQWTFVSIVPSSSLYDIPIRLSVTTIILLLLSFVIGTTLAYYLSRKNYNDLKTIISILDSAQNGRPLPPLPRQVRDVFSFIMQSILNNFIEQNYLKVQLSERKYKSQALEFAALQSQLNPHFLFNTLETLNWKATKLTGRPNELNAIIEDLSDILRYSLEGGAGQVTLKKEIDHTLPYIDIQKIRYKDKFDVIWDCDPEALKYHVLKLMFQPLIENSLYHGIKEKEGSCCIKVRVRFGAACLHIAVIDNGVGILPERLTLLNTQLTGNLEQIQHIGLFNTQKRLKLTYGEKYGVKVRSKFGWGTAIYIDIPID